MLLNGTSGTLRLVGDYDSAGQPVARIENRMQGTHSRHTASPTVEDTLRGADGLPSATPNPAFQWDNLVYHKYAAIDVVQPPGRPNREQFIDYLLRAAQAHAPVHPGGRGGQPAPEPDRAGIGDAAGNGRACVLRGRKLA